jgi:hypothetical protein
MSDDLDFDAVCDAVESGEISLADATDEELLRIIALCRRVMDENPEEPA